MGKINYGRVLIGGLLAGVVLIVGELILNGLVVEEAWRAFMEQHGFPEETTGVMVLYFVTTILFGIAIVLQYALMRPRCGPGPKTAVSAGLMIWFVAWLLGFGGMGISMGIPTWLVLVSLAWGLVEVVLAALAGGWAYKEEEAPAPVGAE